MAWEHPNRKPLPKDWWRLRWSVLERDDHKCQQVENGSLCGKVANQVDHITARAMRVDDSMENLRALCAEHHRSKSGREGAEARRSRIKNLELRVSVAAARPADTVDPTKYPQPF